MFSIDDEDGDKQSSQKTFGLKEKNQAILQFYESGSEDDEPLNIASKNAKVVRNSNNSQAQESPFTGNGQSLIEKQRQNQKKGLNGPQFATMSLNSRPGTGYSYGQNTNIDFTKLKTIVNENPSGMYVQDEKEQKGIDLASLSKSNNLVKFNKEDNKQKQLDDSDDEEDDEEEEEIRNEILTSKSQMSEMKFVQKANSSNALKKESEIKQNLKDKSNALLKDIYGDSSNESEEEQESHLQQVEGNDGSKNNLMKENDEEENNEPIQQAPLAQAIREEEQKAQEGQQQPNPLAYQVAGEIEILNMKDFLTRPVQKGIIIQTCLRRDKSGFARFYPKYHLHLQSNLKYLMTGKKRSINKTSNYLISASKTELTKRSPFYLGKLRSNFLGTEFHVYDTGKSPKKCKNIESIRKELAIIHYESNIVGQKGPRKMNVLTPTIQANGEPLEIRPLNSKEGMLVRVKTGQVEGIKFFKNKPPKWNEQLKSFVLNFNGRVDRASIKNFQLIDDDQLDEQVLLQFGRTGEETFSMDVCYPFSILQAFGIVLSSFDPKIACY